MTKKQFLKMTNEIIAKTAKAMRAKAETMAASGAVDFDAYEDCDYRLSKVAMHALCKEAANQWRPLSASLDREFMKEAENLYLFI